MLYLVIFLLLLWISLNISVFLLKVEIAIEYVKNGRDDNLVFFISSLWGILRYRREIPMIKVDKKGIKTNRAKKTSGKEDVEKDVYTKFTELLDRFKHIFLRYRKNHDLFCRIKLYLGKKLIIKDFRFDMIIGTGDAALTALAAGTVWTVVGILASFIFNNFKVSNKKINIGTYFAGPKLEVDFFCIIKVKFVHIIVVVVVLLTHYIRMRFTFDFFKHYITNKGRSIHRIW